MFPNPSPSAAPFTSPDYTKLSPLENTSLAGLEQMAMNFATPSEATKTSQGALTNIIDTADKGFEDYYRTNIAEPITRTFNESILPESIGSTRMISSQRIEHRILIDLSSEF